MISTGTYNQSHFPRGWLGTSCTIQVSGKTVKIVLASLYKQAGDATELLPCNAVPICGIAEKGQQTRNDVEPISAQCKFMKFYEILSMVYSNQILNCKLLSSVSVLLLKH